MRILFVDNHPEFTSVTLSFLSEHDVVVVPTIAAARAEFQQASRFESTSATYDLDDGKGDELVRWLRLEGNNVPVIAVSARAEADRGGREQRLREAAVQRDPARDPRADMSRGRN